MGLIDEILSSAPKDIKSAPEDVKVAYTALRLTFGFEDPIEDLIWFGKDTASENGTCNGYTTYAKYLNEFLDHIAISLREKNNSPLKYLAPFEKLIELYSIAKAYDKSEDVRRAVDIIEGDARVPRDVRELMRRIRDSETRKMLYDLVDSVILKPLEKLGKGEKLEEVTERLNRLVDHAKFALTAYGELVSGELDGKVGPHLYDHIGNESISGNILNFGWSIEDDRQYSAGKIGDIGEYRRPVDEDWAYQVKNLYNITKEIMGLCAETLEKYINV